MSTLGVYTVVSYFTARRTKEVALRRAIGASASDVLRLLGVPTMGWALVGLVFGMGGAIAAANVLRSIVLEVAVPTSTRPPMTPVAFITAMYLVVVAIAVLVPASRALRVQPASILRAE
jgi:putative ABC transport system permease protein